MSKIIQFGENVEGFNIPVLNERIFKWIIFEPHHKDIETLWKVGIEKRYMPQENVHYKSTDFDAYFGDYKFIIFFFYLSL